MQEKWRMQVKKESKSKSVDLEKEDALNWEITVRVG